MPTNERFKRSLAGKAQVHACRVAKGLSGEGSGMNVTHYKQLNVLGEGRERGLLREASSGEAATSTDGLEG